MREKTIQYLMAETRIIKKMFCVSEDQTLSLDTLAILAILVDLIGNITDRLDYPTKLEE